jgi:glutamate synthase domain-containing protein 2
MKKAFYWGALVLLIVILLLGLHTRHALYLLIPWGAFLLLGLYDVFFSKHLVTRTYPVIGHLRYILESIRPEIQQYFIATNQSGRPYNREQRTLVYDRARGENDRLPFGTQQDITAVGYESTMHSLAPKKVPESCGRILLGGEHCKLPYDASRLNISAMSFGALSDRAVRSLNLGAKIGNFMHNTGEGGLSKYHLQEGGTLCWQIASAYFGCRTEDDRFDPEQFKIKAALPQVKVIEIKLSQGAKPGLGGLLPGAKVTAEIAEARGVPVGKTCHSPAAHTEFSTPTGLLEFMQRLRELSGGKPVGFKLCIGKRSEFMGICKAMLNTGILPDFITVDGAEGGTGASQIEFSDNIGTPINEGLVFVNSCLIGVGLRDKIRIIASGKVASGFDLITKISLGADMCNAARAMLFSLGCIQATRCHTNTCPTGITTQDPTRKKSVHVHERGPMVASFHEKTIASFLDIAGAMGLEHVDDLSPGLIMRRGANELSVPYSELYHYLKVGELLGDEVHPKYASDWALASADHF